MKNLFKKQYIIPAIYLLLTVICILLAFDYEGNVNIGWWLTLCGLTLPWSLASIVFIWALTHGAALEFFTVMYLAFALINVFIIYFIAKPKKKIDKFS